jgi:hypothetical protein
LNGNAYFRTIVFELCYGQGLFWRRSFIHFDVYYECECHKKPELNRLETGCDDVGEALKKGKYFKICKIVKKKWVKKDDLWTA